VKFYINITCYNTPVSRDMQYYETMSLSVRNQSKEDTRSHVNMMLRLNWY